MGNGVNRKDTDATLVGEIPPELRKIREEKKAGQKKATFVVISGPNLGEMYRIGSGGIVGRGDAVAITLNDSECSRHHARIEVQGEKVLVEDLESTNGTFVNGERIKTALLADGDRLQVGAKTVLRLSYQDEAEEEFQKQLFRSAMRDGLTGAYNKRYFDERVESEFAFAKRHGTHIALLLLDLDYFKQLNDTHGHQAGDEVLKAFAARISRAIRREDMFARVGGEEFVILSRGSGAEEAKRFGERLRVIIADQPFTYAEKPIPITMSVGVSGFPNRAISSVQQLISAADSALYAAKRAGRNRVDMFVAEETD